MTIILRADQLSSSGRSPRICSFRRRNGIEHFLKLARAIRRLLRVTGRARLRVERRLANILACRVTLFGPRALRRTEFGNGVRIRIGRRDPSLPAICCNEPSQNAGELPVISRHGVRETRALIPWFGRQAGVGNVGGAVALKLTLRLCC